MAVHDLDMTRFLAGADPVEILAVGASHIDKSIEDLPGSEALDTASYIAVSCVAADQDHSDRHRPPHPAGRDAPHALAGTGHRLPPPGGFEAHGGHGQSQIVQRRLGRAL